MSKIQTYTITATTMIATSNGAGKIEYNATSAPPNVTPDSQGEWCKYEDHIAALVAQGDELALLRLELADARSVIEDQQAEIKNLNRMVDMLTAEL